MKFYAREQQLKQIKDLFSACDNHAQMCLITGRKGTGKTTLALKATEGTPTLYFYVTRKAEPMLCREFSAEMQRVLGIHPHTEITDFRSLFKLLIVESEKRKFNLIIDEVQEFSFIDNSIFKDIASIWERNVPHSKMCLLLVGDNLKHMNALYKGKNALFAPLLNLLVPLTPFSIAELKALVSAHCPNPQEALLALYAFTGGVPEYLAPLMDAKAFTPAEIAAIYCAPNSPFLHEGIDMIVRQVGKEYTFYFSILNAIASDITSRAQIEETLNKEIGGYLTRIENEFGLILKCTPILAKTVGKNVRYIMTDNFLRFWFLYIYGYSSLLSRGKYEELQQIIVADYEHFSLACLKNYFTQVFEEKENYNIIGSWWSNNDEENIDLVALNATESCGTIAKIASKVEAEDAAQLQEMAQALEDELQYYKVSYKTLTPADM